MRPVARAREILVAIGAITALAGCASPGASAGSASGAPSAPVDPTAASGLSASARPVFEVFDAIARHHVTPPDFARLRLSAVRALAKDLPPERYGVADTPTGVRVDYTPAGAARASLTLSGPPTARDAALDVGRAIDAAGAVAPDADRVARTHAMLTRVVRELDPDSRFFGPADLRSAAQTTGEIGVILGRRGGELMVVAVVEMSPAARAGVRPGDRIVTVNGEELREQKNATVNERLRGAVGSRVTLGLRRPEWPVPREIELTRAAVTMPTVLTENVGEGIVLFTLRRFAEGAPRLLATALDNGARQGMRGIVLDLRDDPGGLLTAAIEVAELFLPPRRLIVYTEGRERTANMRFSARARPEDEPTYLTQPAVILINEESAGASEILAAALQESGRATVVGATSAGHGSIQQIVDLSNGAAMSLTIAYLFTPKARRLQDRGVMPDVVVPSSTHVEIDAPLRRAIELLAAQIPNT